MNCVLCVGGTGALPPPPRSDAHLYFSPGTSRRHPSQRHGAGVDELLIIIILSPSPPHTLCARYVVGCSWSVVRKGKRSRLVGSASCLILRRSIVGSSTNYRTSRVAFGPLRSDPCWLRRVSLMLARLSRQRARVAPLSLRRVPSTTGDLAAACAVCDVRAGQQNREIWHHATTAGVPTRGRGTAPGRRSRTVRSRSRREPSPSSTRSTRP